MLFDESILTAFLPKAPETGPEIETEIKVENQTAPVSQTNSFNASLLGGAIFQLVEQSEKVQSGGRGQAWFLESGEVSAVLRVYQRGGLLAGINQQTYFAIQAEHSRAFKEWRMLNTMYEQGLPVPRPIAASICRWPIAPSPFYRAHILIEKIKASRTLDERLARKPLDEERWKAIGRCIALFHQHGIYHADLNANNVMLDDESKVYLIDFDKSEYRQNNANNWKLANLQRLKRSLLKQQTLHSQYYFTEPEWQYLLSAYRGFSSDR